jgi:hypothetical protein
MKTGRTEKIPNFPSSTMSRKGCRGGLGTRSYNNAYSFWISAMTAETIFCEVSRSGGK